MTNLISGTTIIHRLTAWIIHPEGYITDQGSFILTHKEKDELLQAIDNFYSTYSDDDIAEG
jgi:hypothetical protein